MISHAGWNDPCWTSKQAVNTNVNVYDSLAYGIMFLWRHIFSFMKFISQDQSVKSILFGKVGAIPYRLVNRCMCLSLAAARKYVLIIIMYALISSY